MDFTPPEFRQVPYGSVEASTCAPRIDDLAFRGIVIRAPARIEIGAGEPLRLPLCGFYQLPSLPLAEGAVMEVHVRAIGGPPVSGQVVIDTGENEPDIPNPADAEPLDRKLWAKKVSEAYFHLDAQRYLPQRLVPGRYEAYVSYGDARSNVVQFEVAGP